MRMTEMTNFQMVEKKIESVLAPFTNFSPLDTFIDVILTSREPHGPNEAYRSSRGIARAALMGVMLSAVATACLFFIPTTPQLWQLLLVTAITCVYHLAEFLLTAMNHPGDVNTENFLVYYSFDYRFFRLLYHLEFFAWHYFYQPDHLSTLSFVMSGIGLLGVIVGQVLRTLAMYHCGVSFTHVIQQEKAESHVLVTTGVYKYIRHPSYLGWGIWACSVQLVLGNWLCLALSVVMVSAFFKDRIAAEEKTLVEFFGQKFIDYRRRTPTYIPGIA